MYIPLWLTVIIAYLVWSSFRKTVADKDQEIERIRNPPRVLTPEELAVQRAEREEIARIKLENAAGWAAAQKTNRENILKEKVEQKEQKRLAKEAKQAHYADKIRKLEAEPHDWWAFTIGNVIFYLGTIGGTVFILSMLFRLVAGI